MGMAASRRLRCVLSKAEQIVARTVTAAAARVADAEALQEWQMSAEHVAQAVQELGLENFERQL